MVAETWIIAAAFAASQDAQATVLGWRQHGFSEQDSSVLYTDAGHTIRAGLLGVRRGAASWAPSSGCCSRRWAC